MNSLIRKLEHFTRFDEQELRALEALTELPVVYGPHADIIREGDNPTGVNIVIEGYAIRYKTLENGRRQILGYFLPGDICDLRIFVLRRMDHTIAALTQVAVRQVSERRVVELIQRFPRIMRAFWWSTVVEESITREWLLSLGQRTAAERVAHLFCEIFYRARAVGLTRGESLDFPLRQTDLAEMTGLSVVHVNRVLQGLRKRDLVVFDGQTLKLPAFRSLADYAQFDPLYLHMDEKRDSGAADDTGRIAS